MNTKLLGAFVIGMLVSFGIAAWVVNKRQAPEPALTNAVLPSGGPEAPVTEPTRPMPMDIPAVTPQTPEEPVKPVAPEPRRRAQVRKSTPPSAPAEQAATPSAPKQETSAPIVIPPSPPPMQEPARAETTPATPPPPPPTPRSVTIPAGTLINARLNETLTTERNSAGDAFSATLDQPIIVNGLVIAERGSKLEGKIVESTPAGRVKGVSSISVELLRLTSADGQKVEIKTQPFAQQGEKSVKSDAAKVGVAAGIGAAIGAIAGGGKGAAIGAGVGGAAGAGGVMATRGKHATLPVETRISFRLQEPVTMTERLP